MMSMEGDGVVEIKEDGTWARDHGTLAGDFRIGHG